MKRFTETTKWADPWFRRLSPHAKLLWQWLLDNCDHAGVIALDLELASFHIGYPMGIDTLSELGERVRKLDAEKYFMPKFIEFQYSKLSKECKAHRPVFQSIEKHGLCVGEPQNPKGMDTLPDRVPDTPQDKDKDKDKDKDSPKPTEELPPPAPAKLDFVSERQQSAGEIARKIMNLRREWRRPAAMTAIELHEIAANLAAFQSLTDDDWELLKAYLSANVPQGAGFWQPANRSKFISTIADVLGHADRWATKTGRTRKSTKPRTREAGIK